MNLLLAYFDPSAGSLLLQALVGGFGGVIVLGRYTWTHFMRYKRTPAVTARAAQNQPSIQ